MTSIITKLKRSAKVFLVSFLIVVSIVLIIGRIFLFSVINVPTGSMSPTIGAGYNVILLRVGEDTIERGDVIAFYSAEKRINLIKRVVGLPGETIAIRNGTVYVDGELLVEDYVKNNFDYTGTFTVPDDCYLFLGDNRSNSSDARYWEQPYIYKSYVLGKAFITFYPKFKRVK